MHSHHWRQKGTLSGNKNQFQISSEVFEFCASFWPENFFVLVREQRIEPRSSPTFIETMGAAKCARHHSIPNNWPWISENEHSSGQALYYGHLTTSQNIQLPYIFCKVDLNSNHPVYNSHLSISQEWSLYTGLTVTTNHVKYFICSYSSFRSARLTIHLTPVVQKMDICYLYPVDNIIGFHNTNPLGSKFYLSSG